MFKKTVFFIALFLIFCNAYQSEAVTEREPNNTSEQANPINLNDTVSGIINYGDGSDYYRLVFPQSGIATVNISGYPSDCIVQIVIAGFHPNYPTETAGFVSSDRGRPLSFSFSEMGNKTGYISVRLSSVASSVCSGSDWCAVQCTANGPYYLTPFTDRPVKNVPASYEGKPVLSPIRYQFAVTLQALPDKYEPNYQEGMTKEQMLQKGIIKTIPIGQEITAYLFNEYPAMMRGTKGYENTLNLGGENDTDIYHIYLNQPDTVKVILRNFPLNANSKIVITDSSGNWDESKTGATYFEQKITKPGNVFIEISRGRENRPLIYSTTPYGLIVTTGSAVVPPVTPPDERESGGWVNYIKSGRAFKVIFDIAPSKFNDEGWLGANDPMGTLKGGETYTVFYNANTGWTVTGYNEGTGSVGTWTYKEISPDNYQLNLWGRVYSFNDKGDVFDLEYGLVGHLSRKTHKKDREVINNGNLRTLNSWTIHEWYKPSDGKGEVIIESDGIRFKSMSGNRRIGIMQTLNTDVSSCSSLVLTAAIKADYQTLGGTGWQGRESPVALFMAYTDVNGVVHNLLSENPNDTARRMFWHGFYYADPTPPGLTVFGTKVQKGIWHTYTLDLMTLNPRPKFIHFIGAEGAGWAQRDGRIGSISLQCRGEASVQQPYQPPVATQPDSGTGQPLQYYQPPVTQQPYQPNVIPQYPETHQPLYPSQGAVPEFKGEDDFWKGNINIYERK
jgi:hypothetical protein